MNDHFLYCNNPVIQEERKTSEEGVHNKLHSYIMIRSNIFTLLHLGNKQWIPSNTPPWPEFCYNEYYQLFEEQTEIGWGQLIKERPTVTWIDIQKAYDIFSKLNGVIISSKAGSYIVKMISTMWKY